MRFRSHALGTWLLLALAANGTYAQAPASSLSSGPVRNSTAGRRTVRVLHNGRNSVDLLGKGGAGEVVVSRRDNFNAHGFSVILFQVHAPTTPGTRKSAELWQAAPFFGGADDPPSGNVVITTDEGADCTLRDLRVLPGKGSLRTEVVIANREMGASFADSAAVRFDFYEMRVNTDGIAGWPAYYFDRVKSQRAKRRYCDVDDAFDKELGLGRAGVVRWDGPR